MKKYLPTVIAVLLVASVAAASAIKNWSTGEVLLSSDLNAALNHLHGTMVGGHGARLVNADVNSGAAIAHSKLATPALVPKAWGYVADACTSDPCTIGTDSGVFAINYTSTGIYTVTLDANPANSAFAVVVTAISSAGTIGCRVSSTAGSAPAFTINCIDKDGTAANAGFSFVYLDN